MKLNLTVEGMHCSGCSMLLKDVVEEIKGVKSAEFDHAEGNAVVEFDNSVVSKEVIVDSITKEGYKVIL
jgi:copper chaperone CopZ